MILGMRWARQARLQPERQSQVRLWAQRGVDRLRAVRAEIIVDQELRGALGLRLERGLRQLKADLLQGVRAHRRGHQRLLRAHVHRDVRQLSRLQDAQGVLQRDGQRRVAVRDAHRGQLQRRVMPGQQEGDGVVEAGVNI